MPSLMMEADKVSETLGINFILTGLVAQEGFITVYMVFRSNSG
jgi:hypothetical protein